MCQISGQIESGTTGRVQRTTDNGDTCKEFQFKSSKMCFIIRNIWISQSPIDDRMILPSNKPLISDNRPSVARVGHCLLTTKESLHACVADKSRHFVLLSVHLAVQPCPSVIITSIACHTRSCVRDGAVSAVTG